MMTLPMYLSSTKHLDTHLILLLGSKPIIANFTPHTTINTKQDKNSDTNTNKNTGLKSYITNSMVLYQTRTHFCISIGARSVVTTRLLFAVGVDALKIIMNFIIV
jgi:hypothetical protein